MTVEYVDNSKRRRHLYQLTGMPNTTECNLFERSGKSQAEVTNNEKTNDALKVL